MSHACHRLGNATKPSRFCSLLTRCIIPCACHAKRHLNVQKCSEPDSFLHFWLRNVLRTTTACTFSTSQLPKVLRTRQFFTLWASQCASPHNTVHFFDISTSKSGPSMVRFAHFDFHMCFAPQRRATFHLSSDHMAPHPPLERAYFSTLRSHKSLEKHSVSRLSYLFAHLDLLSSETFSFLIFFLLLFSSLTLPISAFHLSTLSEVWLLNFLRLYYYHWLSIGIRLSPKRIMGKYNHAEFKSMFMTYGASQSNIIATAHMARLRTARPAKITFQIRTWWWTTGFSASPFSDQPWQSHVYHRAPSTSQHVPPTRTSGCRPQLDCTEGNAWNDSRARQKCNPGERRAYTAAVKPSDSTNQTWDLFNTYRGLKL